MRETGRGFGVEVERGWFGFADQRVAVAQEYAIAVAAECQRLIQRRRRAERGFGGAVDFACEESADIAAIAGGGRAVEARVDGQSAHGGILARGGGVR